MRPEKALIFLCSGTAKLTDKKLSHRIAAFIQENGLGEVGTLTMLDEQRSTARRRKMIFINDCKASCVKLLTHGFEAEDYMYVDVAPYKNSPEFDLKQFVETEIIPNILQDSV